MEITNIERVWVERNNLLARNISNRVMIVAVKPTVVHQVWIKVVEVKLGSVMNQLQSMTDLERHMQQKESDWYHDPMGIQLTGHGGNPSQNSIELCTSNVRLPHIS